MRLHPYLPLIVAGVFVAFFVVEKLFPLRERRAGLLARLVVNLAISAMAFLTAMIAVKPSALHALNWVAQKPFGLLRLAPLPEWARFIAGYSAPGDNRLWRALTMPFRKQRDYWCKQDGKIPERDTAILEEHRTRLAE